MVAVAFVCPTLDRPEWHESMYGVFRRQTLREKKLYVLDESARPSPFFGRLRDPRVVYAHEPGPARIGGVPTIGRARNRVNSLTAEPFLSHLDDDDEVSPEWAETMLSRIKDAALAKLGVWRAYHLPTRTIFEWDTRRVGGPTYAVQGAAIEKVDAEPSDVLYQIGRLGWGFSYFMPRSTWERKPFPTEGTEDFPWARSLQEEGKKFEFVDDRPDLILHTVHEGSPSAIYPQRIVGRAAMVAASPMGLRGALRDRMIGSMSGMHPLPDGKPINVVPGATYSLLVSLKKSHSLKSLAVRAGSWGVTVKEARDNVEPSEFGVSAPGGKYRLVHVTASSSKPGRLPWRVPSPLSVFDKTTIVKAWTDAPMVGARPMYGAPC